MLLDEKQREDQPKVRSILNFFPLSTPKSKLNLNSLKSFQLVSNLQKLLEVTGTHLQQEGNSKAQNEGDSTCQFNQVYSTSDEQEGRERREMMAGMAEERY